MMQTKCVCCGSEEVVYDGDIPQSFYFAGRLLSVPIEGGALMKCLACGLAFRYPRLDKMELDELYRQGKVENWQAISAARSDWRIASHFILQLLPSDIAVLDVGCFDGGFFRVAGTGYERFGLEIHEAACQKAQENGVHIIGRDFTDLSGMNATFDAVTSFDVIEHTHDPFNFLADLVGVTRENGIIILSSGNSDTFGWRLLKANYWYCVIGEHLSFINPRWCAWAASRLGIELIQVVEFSHSNATWQEWLIDFVKNLLYFVTPRGFSFLRSIGLGGSEYRKNKDMLRHPPSWMSAKDHFICVFVKK